MNEEYFYTGNWWYFEGKEDGVYVMPVCPDCHKFISQGKVSVNGFETIKLEGFICHTHGDIEPEFMWKGDFEES